jgi:hypothetical protein
MGLIDNRRSHDNDYDPRQQQADEFVHNTFVMNDDTELHGESLLKKTLG